MPMKISLINFKWVITNDRWIPVNGCRHLRYDHLQFQSVFPSQLHHSLHGIFLDVKGGTNARQELQKCWRPFYFPHRCVNQPFFFIVHFQRIVHVVVSLPQKVSLDTNWTDIGNGEESCSEQSAPNWILSDFWEVKSIHTDSSTEQFSRWKATWQFNFPNMANSEDMRSCQRGTADQHGENTSQFLIH